MAGSPATARAAVDVMLAQITREVAALPEAHVRQLAPIMAEARRELATDLGRWLKQHPDGDERFTAQRYREAMLQLDTALKVVRQRLPGEMLGLLGEQGDAAAELALKNLKKQVLVHAKHFGGENRALPLRTASLVERGAALLMPRYRSTLERYGADGVGIIQRQLAIGFMRNETFAELTQRLVKNAGGVMREAWGADEAAEKIAGGFTRSLEARAARIVRTEGINTYNALTDAAIDDLDADDPGWGKKWDASADKRACLKCRKLDGKVIAPKVPKLAPVIQLHPPAPPPPEPAPAPAGPTAAEQKKAALTQAKAEKKKAAAEEKQRRQAEAAASRQREAEQAAAAEQAKRAAEEQQVAAERARQAQADRAAAQARAEAAAQAKAAADAAAAKAREEAAAATRAKAESAAAAARKLAEEQAQAEAAASAAQAKAAARAARMAEARARAEAAEREEAERLAAREAAAAEAKKPHATGGRGHSGIDFTKATGIGGLHGQGFRADGDFIEGHAVRLVECRDEAGRTYYEATFKVTAAHQAKIDALPYDKEENWAYRKRDLRDGILSDTGLTRYMKEDFNEGTPDMTARTRKADGYTVDLGMVGAMRNQIRVRAGSLEDANRAMDELGAALGGDLRRAPSAADTELLAKARLAAKWRPDVFAGMVHGASGSAEHRKAVEAAFEGLAAKDPMLRKALTDVEEREVYPGHVSLYSKTLGEHLAKTAKISFLTHDGSTDPETLAKMIGANGLLASASRYERGIFANGMSTGPDFESGGADSVFTRIITEETASYERSRSIMNFRLVLDADENLGRLDWYAFNRDKYGITDDASFEDRWGVPMIINQAQHREVHAQNEVMFQKGVSASSIRGVVINASEEMRGRLNADGTKMSGKQYREKLIAELRAAGHEQVNGVKLEEFIKMDGQR